MVQGKPNAKAKPNTAVKDFVNAVEDLEALLDKKHKLEQQNLNMEHNLEGKLVQTTKELKEAQGKVTTCEKESLKKEEKQKVLLAELQKEKDTLVENHRQASEKASNLETNLASLKGNYEESMAATKEEKAALEAQLQAEKAKIEELQAMLQAKQEELEKEKAVLEEKLKSEKAKLVEATAKTARAKDLEAEKTKLDAEAAKLRKDVEASNEKLEKETARAKDLEAAKTKLDAEVARLKNSESSKDDLSKEITRLKEVQAANAAHSLNCRVLGQHEDGTCKTLTEKLTKTLADKGVDLEEVLPFAITPEQEWISQACILALSVTMLLWILRRVLGLIFAISRWFCRCICCRRGAGPTEAKENEVVDDKAKEPVDNKAKETGPVLQNGPAKKKKGKHHKKKHGHGRHKTS